MEQVLMGLVMYIDYVKTWQLRYMYHITNGGLARKKSTRE